MTTEELYALLAMDDTITWTLTERLSPTNKVQHQLRGKPAGSKRCLCPITAAYYLLHGEAWGLGLAALVGRRLELAGPDMRNLMHMADDRGQAREDLPEQWAALEQACRLRKGGVDV